MCGVRRNLRDNLVPTALPWAGTLSVCIKFIQPGLELLQGWGIRIVVVAKSNS